MSSTSTRSHDGPDIGDAFGMQLRDSLRLGRPAMAFMERSDGLIAPSDPTPWLNEEADWPSAVRELLGAARGRVLDAGAGAGRHATHLARKGHDVTALDTSPLALELCDRHVRVTCVLGELADSEDLFADASPFDTVLLLGNNVGLLGSAAAGAETLRQLHAITTDDAAILAEGRCPVANTSENAAYVESNLRHGRLPGEMRLRIRYLTTATDWFPYLFCEPAELSTIASSAGWGTSQVNAFRYPHDPPRQSPLSYTAVLRKRSG